jgi:hypothetical protein
MKYLLTFMVYNVNFTGTVTNGFDPRQFFNLRKQSHEIDTT